MATGWFWPLTTIPSCNAMITHKWACKSVQRASLVHSSKKELVPIILEPLKKYQPLTSNGRYVSTLYGHPLNPNAQHLGTMDHRTEKAGLSLGRHFLQPRHNQFHFFPIVRPTHGHICHMSNHKTNERFLRVRYRFHNQHTTNLLYDQSHDQ